MKIWLVAGTEHKTVADFLVDAVGTVVVNKTVYTLCDAADTLRENAFLCDKVMIVDGALSTNSDKNKSDLDTLLKQIDADVTVVTRDFLFCAPCSRVSVFVSPWLRSTATDLPDIGVQA